jgi:hypothetical protein
MKEDDFFLQRVNVNLANLLQGYQKFDLLRLAKPELEFVQRAKLALSQDVSPECYKLLLDAFDPRASLSQLGPKLLKAFWAHAASELANSLVTAPAQLLVNPPDHLTLKSTRNVVTVRFQPWLTGSYGQALARWPDAVDLLNVKSTLHGFFDNVVIFWDLGVDSEKLGNFICPGSTLTLARPSYRAHAWLKVCDLDLSCAELLRQLSAKFKLVTLSDAILPKGISLTTLGVEVL